MTDQTTLIESDQAEKGKILLIGDLLIDKTYYVKPTKISPEAPVLVASTLSPVPIEKAGGAGLAASYAVKNIDDTDFIFYTAISKEKKKWLEEKGINIQGYIIPDENIITKTRYIDEVSKYHIIRIDNDLAVGKYNIDYRKFCLLYYKLREKKLDGVVLLDYRKGIFSNERLVNKIISAAKENKIPVYVDSRNHDISKFKGATWIKVNSKEYENAKEVLNCNCPKEIIKKLECNGLIITKGEEGAELYTSTSDLYYDYKALVSNNSGTPDVTGCGDVFDIVFSNSLFVEKKSISESLIIACNKASNFAYQPIKTRL